MCSSGGIDSKKDPTDYAVKDEQGEKMATVELKPVAFIGDKLDSEAYSVMSSDGKVVLFDYTGILNLFGL